MHRKIYKRLYLQPALIVNDTKWLSQMDRDQVEINQIFQDLSVTETDKVASQLEKLGMLFRHERNRTFATVGLIDTLCLLFMESKLLEVRLLSIRALGNAIAENGELNR